MCVRLHRFFATTLVSVMLASAGFVPVTVLATTELKPSVNTTSQRPELLLKLKQKPSGDGAAYVRALLTENRLTPKEVHKVLKGKTKNAGITALGDQLFFASLDNPGDIKAVARTLMRDGRIEYAEPNATVSALTTPDDEFFPQQWALDNIGQTGGTPDADIDAPEAWDTTHDSTLVVGVIDTGVDYTHPDLAANMWKNPGEIAGNNIDDDGNGYIDDIYGWDFVNEDNDPMDDFGHGTHVSGTIGADTNNGIGIAGINWKVKIAALKFLDAFGGGTYEDAVEAVAYANAMGFPITSNSWGGGGFSQALYDVIAAGNAQGRLFVAAAGNSGDDSDINPLFPAAFDLPNIISVAATNHTDNLSFFSNYGLTSVDLGAPGEDILSTVPSGDCVLCDPSGYISISGTSMATPHVSGAAALLWSTQPGLTTAELKQKLLDRTDPFEDLAGKSMSEGRLNLNNLFDDDSTPPAAVTDLAGEAAGHNKITVHWTATGDDGTTGTASRYDVRYSLAPITAANFDAATPVTGEPLPGAPGILETVSIKNLDPSTTYYVALKVLDNIRNSSPLSNVAAVTTNAAVTIYNENFEHGENGWTTNGIIFSTDNLWHLSTRRSVSPNTSWYYGIESQGNYDTGSKNVGSLTSPVIPLHSVQSPELLFSHFLDTEDSLFYDIALVQVKATDAKNWDTLLQRGTTNGKFVRESFDLGAYEGKLIQVRFIFDTIDNTIQLEGWYIDDVIIRGGPPPNALPVAVAGPDQTAFLNKDVKFDGSLSYDKEGPVTYAWNFGDSSPIEKKATVKHKYKGFGTFTATLTVTDLGGQTASDTAVIKVIDDVSITTSKYDAKKKTLSVRAKSSAGNKADLTLIGFANVIKSSNPLWTDFTVNNLPTKPANVTVQSSLGGQGTAVVK